MEINFPDAEIKFHSARGVTGKIQVSWIKDGKKQVVWAKGRQETAQGEEEILALMKQNQ
jgi:hypothetical protein